MTGKKRLPSPRRLSRESSASRLHEDNPFDDENDIESFGVADGFQSSFNLQHIPSTSHEQEQESTSSKPRTKSSVFRDSKKKPSSTQDNAPPLIPRNSFSLRHDAQYSDQPRRIPSISSSVGQPQQSNARPLSMLSRQSTFVRPESTYNGPSAPSHPYGMYPQNSTETNAHRVSMASIPRPTRERSFHGREAPTHPYAMYPQNPVSDSDTETLNASTDITSVGFLGLSHQYARRLGPDGEEADDIIGPDGHTEQLPPYTRYANIGPMPLRPMPPKRDSRVTVGQLPTIPADAASIANDANSMSDTLLSPTAYDSTVHLANSESPNSAAKEKWSKRSRKKTCFGRLPVWAVALLIVFLIAASAAMGGVIGRFLGKPRRPDPNSQSTTDNSTIPTSTSSAPLDPSMPTFLVTPVPTAGPPPPSIKFGPFDLALYPPTEECATCLMGSQRPAWDCMADSTTLNFTVENPLDTAAQVTLAGPPPNTIPLLYGGQSPSFQGIVTKSLSFDPNNQSAGNAVYFNGTYQKQVLLSYDTGKSLSIPFKRSVEGVGSFEERQLLSRGQKAKDIIANGALVWNCLWPGTNIDGFIFVDIDAPPRIPTSTSPVSNTYPKKVQVREYRIQGSPQATCSLMKNQRGILVAPDSIPTGLTSPFNLQESDPAQQSKFAMSKWAKLSHEKRDAYQGYCYCELANTS